MSARVIVETTSVIHGTTPPICRCTCICGEDVSAMKQVYDATKSVDRCRQPDTHWGPTACDCAVLVCAETNTETGGGEKLTSAAFGAYMDAYAEPSFDSFMDGRGQYVSDLGLRATQQPPAYTEAEATGTSMHSRCTRAHDYVCSTAGSLIPVPE
jgi:hypothetical protein